MMAEWIDVNDRLPQKPIRCLVYTRRGDVGGYDIAYYGCYYDGFFCVVWNSNTFDASPRTAEAENERW